MPPGFAPLIPVPNDTRTPIALVVMLPVDRQGSLFLPSGAPVRTLRFRYNATSFQDSRGLPARLTSSLLAGFRASVYTPFSSGFHMQIPPRESESFGDISGHDRNGFLFPLLNQEWPTRSKPPPNAWLDGNGRGSHYEEISMKSTIQGSLLGIGRLVLLLQPSAQAACGLRGKKVGLAPSKTRAEAAKSGGPRQGGKWRLQQLIDCWLVAYHLHRRRPTLWDEKPSSNGIATEPN